MCQVGRFCFGDLERLRTADTRPLGILLGAHVESAAVIVVSRGYVSAVRSPQSNPLFDT